MQGGWKYWRRGRGAREIREAKACGLALIDSFLETRLHKAWGAGKDEAAFPTHTRQSIGFSLFLPLPSPSLLGWSHVSVSARYQLASFARLPTSSPTFMSHSNLTSPLKIATNSLVTTSYQFAFITLNHHSLCKLISRLDL